jgi:uncharacterized protein YndB with AHSA1/START domain
MPHLPAHRLLAALVTGAALCHFGLAVAAERAVEKEVVINATLDQAWDAWTTREGITSFFAPDARVEARVGGAFQVYMDPGAEPGLRGADDMRIMALQTNKMLTFDWNAPPSLPEARKQRTFVIVRLQPVDERSTRITLHHTGWGDGGEWDKNFVYFDRAWGAVLNNLKKRFAEGPVDWQPWLKQLEAGRAKAAAPSASAPPR